MMVTHEMTGATFTAPDGWQVVPLGPDGVADGAANGVAAIETAAEDFAANLVLTVEELPGASFRDWQALTDKLLPTTLDDYLLLDLERLDVAGRAGGRRLAHHVDEAGRALVMEQWFILHEERGYTLTATIDAPRYAGAASVIDEQGASLRLPDAEGMPA